MKLGHALGLEIHAWINCYILWSSDSLPADSTHILNSNPLWTEADIYGKSDLLICVLFFSTKKMWNFSTQKMWNLETEKMWNLETEKKV